MKLSREQIEKLSVKMYDRLTKNGLLAPVRSRDAVLSRISGTIIDELQAEDRLDEEVKNILDTHRADIESGHVDYNKMFLMIKKKLAEEKKIVL